MSKIYTYSLSRDFPLGKICGENLYSLIRASNIFQSVEFIRRNYDTIEISFKAPLTENERIVLDGFQTGPCNGLISVHDVSEPDQMEQGMYPKETFDRIWAFSHDFADKTTWYTKSIKVEDETVNVNGLDSEFQLGNVFLIDMSHGLISEENQLEQYVPKVTKNDTLLIEREFGEEDGGDYQINYREGKITFFNIPESDSVIKISYYYAGESDYILAPKVHQKFVLDMIEMQFSTDLDLKDIVKVGVFTYNPYLGNPPEKFLYPGSEATFKRIVDFINWTKGSFPIIPAFGGSRGGMTKDLMQLRFVYDPPMELPFSAGAELRVWLKHHRELGGENANFSAYGKVVNEF